MRRAADRPQEELNERTYSRTEREGGTLISTKHLGLLILIICPIAMVAYAYGILFAYTHPIVELSVLAVMWAVLGLLSWIGYTMLTASPTPDVSDLSNPADLQEETINPKQENLAPVKRPRFAMIVDAEIGEGTVVRDHANLYKCKIGRNCKIESFVYIEEGVTIGNDCKIKPHVYIPTGVIIEDEVFLGPNVTFTNDKYPRAKGEWKLLKTVVGRGASIGAQSVVIPGVRIGRNATVGAGSVVTSDVPDDATVAGNPARPLSK